MLEDLTTDDLSPESRKQLASEFSGKLAEALKPEPIRTPMSLYRITAEMTELGELLREALDAGDDAAADAIQTQLTAYLGAEVAKIDGYHGFLKNAANLIEQIKGEENRLRGQRNAWEGAIKRVKAAAVFVMDAMGKKRLEGSHGRRLRLHPSPVSVEVTDAAAVPQDFLVVDVRMSMLQYNRLRNGGEEFISRKDPAEVSLSRIKAFIEAGQKCPECSEGLKPYSHNAAEVCQRCNGTGRIPGHVPGCKLTQGVHLRVE